MTTTKTRYRITVNGETRWQDNMPTDEHLGRIEQAITHRGGHARVDRCKTTIDTDAMGTGQGVSMEDTCVFEIEG